MSGTPLALGEMLDLAAERHPDTPAVIFKNARVTYAGLRERADRFARGLLALGLGPGDHVVIWMPNSIEWNVVHFAIARIGAVTVTCNSRYRALEVEYLLRQSDAKALVMVDRFDAAGVDYLEVLRGIVPEVLWRPDRRLLSAKFPELRLRSCPGTPLSRDPGFVRAGPGATPPWTVTRSRSACSSGRTRTAPDVG